MSKKLHINEDPVAITLQINKLGNPMTSTKIYITVIFIIKPAKLAWKWRIHALETLMCWRLNMSKQTKKLIYVPPVQAITTASW